MDRQPFRPRMYRPGIHPRAQMANKQAVDQIIYSQSMEKGEAISFRELVLHCYGNSETKYIPHKAISKEQQCLLDNLHHAYLFNNPRYFQAILKCLIEYFQSKKFFYYYLVFRGKKSGLYKS